MSACPCGSGRDFEACCGPVLDGAPAASPEALMRSRYAAFVTGDIGHLERTLAPEAKTDFDPGSTADWAREANWKGLEIRSAPPVADGDEVGTVEFVTRFAQGGKDYAHHERAIFRKVDGVWAYADGEINPKQPPRRVEKVGRNDPCPCGSGKKYKKCCGA